MNLPLSVKIGYGVDDTLKVEATSDDDRLNCRKLTKTLRRRETFRQASVVVAFLLCFIFLISASPFDQLFASAILAVMVKSRASSTSRSTT